MSFDSHKNLVSSTIATAPSPATIGTSFILAAGDGAKCPLPPFNAICWPSTSVATAANAEIVRVTAVSTDTLTITRAQEGTTAKSIITGFQFAVPLTAKTLTDIEAASPQLFNIRGYGAVIDGTTDDTTAVQAAITAAESAGGGVIYHPGGTCLIGKVTVSISKGITFAGSGWGSIYYAKNGLNDHMVQFAANVAGMWVNFRDLKFDGNNTNQTAGDIIEANLAIECRFINVWFHSPYNWAVNLLGDATEANYGHHNNFVACLFDQGQASAGQGGAIRTRASDENSISVCEFQYMGGSGSTYNCAIFDNSGLNSWSNSTFVDSRSGVYVLDASQTRIENNMFDRVQYDNVYVKGFGTIVKSNHFYEIGGTRSGTGVASGVIIDYYGNADVSSNIFKASPTNNRTRSFIYDFGNGPVGYKGNNTFIGNKEKTDGAGTTSAAKYDINSTPNTNHSNDSSTAQSVVIGGMEKGILGATVAAPASATSTGTAGDIAYDGSYVYICTGTNQWKRSAIASW